MVVVVVMVQVTVADMFVDIVGHYGWYGGMMVVVVQEDA